MKSIGLNWRDSWLTWGFSTTACLFLGSVGRRYRQKLRPIIQLCRIRNSWKRNCISNYLALPLNASASNTQEPMSLILCVNHYIVLGLLRPICRQHVKCVRAVSANIALATMATTTDKAYHWKPNWSNSQKWRVNPHIHAFHGRLN